MGGAPPLPHDFAPQGAKNVHFLAPPRIRGPRGLQSLPAPVAEGGSGGHVAGEDPRRVSGCRPGNPVWKAIGRRRRPSWRTDSTPRRDGVNDRQLTEEGTTDGRQGS